MWRNFRGVPVCHVPTCGVIPCAALRCAAAHTTEGFAAAVTQAFERPYNGQGEQSQGMGPMVPGLPEVGSQPIGPSPVAALPADRHSPPSANCSMLYRRHGLLVDTAVHPSASVQTVNRGPIVSAMYVCATVYIAVS